VNQLGSRACYEEGKRVAETLAMDYHRQQNVDVRIARIFNTYGPRMKLNDGRVVSNLVTQAVKMGNLSIHGDGNQLRSFCHVSDVVDGLIKLMMADEVEGPVNIGKRMSGIARLHAGDSKVLMLSWSMYSGDPQSVSIVNLAKLIVSLSARDLNYTFQPELAEEARQRTPSIEKAKSILKWEPKVL